MNEIVSEARSFANGARIVQRRGGYDGSKQEKKKERRKSWAMIYQRSKHAKDTTTGVHGPKLDYGKRMSLKTTAKSKITKPVKSSCSILREFERWMPYKLPSRSWTEPHFTRQPYPHLISGGASASRFDWTSL